MILSAPATNATLRNPSQPTLPGMEPDVIARYASYRGDQMTSPVKVVADAKLPTGPFQEFNDAVRAARAIMVGERADARWGLFRRHAGRVPSIALMQGDEGIRLARTTAAMDPYVEPVPGQMFPGQNWGRRGPDKVVRESPATLALVGAEWFVDLRAGTIAVPVELPKR
jgi:hypothetical protein